MCGERWNPPIFLGKTIEVLMNDGSFETDFIFWLIMLIWEAFFPTATSQCKTWTQVLGACLEYIYIYVYSIYIYIYYTYIHTYTYPRETTIALFPWRKPLLTSSDLAKWESWLRFFHPRNHTCKEVDQRDARWLRRSEKGKKNGTVLVVGCRDW